MASKPLRVLAESVPTTNGHVITSLSNQYTMGIDIYARWDGQTAEEASAQFTGCSVLEGKVGYLREAYHGNPYATKYLLREAFVSDDATARIESSVMRRRLPGTLALVEEREREVYNVTDEDEIQLVKQSFIDFVDLCERKEKETGTPVLIRASY